jgi:hypothetical protein
VEKELYREVWSGRLVRPQQSARADGVKVRWVHNGNEKIVSQQEICQEWDAYAAEDAKRHERYVASARARANAHKDVAARLASLQEAMGDRVKLPWWAEGRVYDDGSFSTQGVLTVTELADLLEAAFAAGQEAGR